MHNLTSYDGIPRPDTWLEERQVNPAVLPVSQESFVRKLRPWEYDNNQVRWSELQAPQEPRVIKSQRSPAWDNDPRLHRSYGPSATESKQYAREAAASRNYTERRQREGPFMSEDEPVRIMRNPIRSDFEHDLKNFEQGHRASRVNQEQKKPFGQPVRIPQPPPLPRGEDFSYF